MGNSQKHFGEHILTEAYYLLTAIAQRASTLNFFNTVIGVFAMHLYLVIDF